MQKGHIKAMCVSIVMLIAATFLSQAQQLSKSGAAHLRAAETLLEMASSINDKLLVAEEYEKVTQSDPSYADVYLKLGKLYAALTPELGKEYYDKAKQNYQTYLRLRPAEKDEIDAELVVLDALLRKYNSGPSRLVGCWGFSGYNGFQPYFNIKMQGNDYIVEVTPGGFLDTETINVESSREGMIFKFAVTKFYDRRSELREKGWTKYRNDCDEYADSGWPKYGTYYYNEIESTWYYELDLSGDKPMLNISKLHCKYFLNGSKTYSETQGASVFYKWGWPKALTKR